MCEFTSRGLKIELPYVYLNDGFCNCPRCSDELVATTYADKTFPRTLVTTEHTTLATPDIATTEERALVDISFRRGSAQDFRGNLS